MTASRSTTKHADEMRKLLGDLYLAASRFVTPAKVEKTMRQWLDPRRLCEVDNPDLVLSEAMALALDFSLFAPSVSGKTAIDRFARQHRPANDEERNALAALRQARFRVLTIQDAHPEGGAWTLDLACKERYHVAARPSWIEHKGVIIAARLAMIGEAVMVPVGPVTPLDQAALVVTEKRKANPHRCAEAVYRHAVRFGGPEIAGLNRETENQTRHFPFTARDGVLHKLAFAWADDSGEINPSAEEEKVVRGAICEQALIEILLALALAEERSMKPLFVAYNRLLILQLETIARRSAAGVSGRLASLEHLLVVVNQATDNGALPINARTIFESARRRLAVRGEGASKGDADLDKVLARIQALRLKTVDRGCTEAEAIAAATKVADLLDRHNLSLGEIKLKDQNALGFGVDTGRRRFGPIDGCIPVIGRFCDCRLWSEQDQDGQIRYIFFGLSADTAGARYLYDLIEQAFQTETLSFKKGLLYASHHARERRSATHSFQTGLAQGIGRKLEQLREQREAKMRTSAGRDLVVVKDAVIDQDLDKLGLQFKTRNVSRKRSVLKDAYHAGHEAGDRFSYCPGVEEGAAPGFGGQLE